MQIHLHSMSATTNGQSNSYDIFDYRSLLTFIIAHKCVNLIETIQIKWNACNGNFLESNDQYHPPMNDEPYNVLIQRRNDQIRQRANWISIENANMQSIATTTVDNLGFHGGDTMSMSDNEDDNNHNRNKNNKNRKKKKRKKKKIITLLTPQTDASLLRSDQESHEEEEDSDQDQEKLTTQRLVYLIRPNSI